MKFGENKTAILSNMDNNYNDKNEALLTPPINY